MRRYKILPSKHYKLPTGRTLIVCPVWDFKDMCLVEFAGFSLYDIFLLYDRCGGNTELIADTDSER